MPLGLGHRASIRNNITETEVNDDAVSKLLMEMLELEVGWLLKEVVRNVVRVELKIEKMT
jgi:hypothetical protein